MSIESLAHEVSASQGCSVVTVIAKKKSSGFKSLKQLLAVLKDEDHKTYAEAYHKWVLGGRKGAAPTDENGDVRTWKFIRAAVQQIIAAGK